MLTKSLAVLGFVASSLALSITSPNPSNYWVQFTSNTINWSFSSGDPNPVDITITNSNTTILNGAFSIVRNLDASNGSFTVTNVTLRVAQGYVINFVNGTNQTQVFTTSQQFEVKPGGTPPASGNSNGNGNGNSTGTASGSSASATSPSSSGSASGSGTATSGRGAATSGAALRTLSAGPSFQGLPAIAASSVVALLAACAMF